MASVAQTVRCTARAAARCAAGATSARRAFTSSVRSSAASNFTMPALSPTMTEGNIARWQVKEGESYSTGDVLLEIETDKATMDVEAADDGILMKIISPDGSKAVQVGSRIAVLAEADDDIKSLEIPEDDTPKGQPAKQVQEEKKTMTGKETATQESAQEPQKETKKSDSPPQKETPSQPQQAQSDKPRKQKYPLYPSVQHLLHQNGLAGKADEIPASGPNGRLLKGDVLAFLGKISKDYPAEASARFKKLSHLDLSNIQIALPPPKPAEEPVQAAAVEEVEVPTETELALPISLDAVIATQKRMEDMLHTSLPLSVFIAKASELANERLPLTTPSKPTSEELFNAVLGIPYTQRTASTGRFVPQISTLNLSSTSIPTRSKKPDIFDLLSGTKPKKSQTSKRVADASTPTSENLFSVVAKSGEEERAMIYLERMKYALEKDPGRLVL